MILTPIDRLNIHLLLHYPKYRKQTIYLSQTPGYLIAGPTVINIRGVGYAEKIDGKKAPPLRLWNELHSHFNTHVEVLREKNKQATIISWNGLVYHLDQRKSYRHGRK